MACNAAKKSVDKTVNQNQLRNGQIEHALSSLKQSKTKRKKMSRRDEKRAKKRRTESITENEDEFSEQELVEEISEDEIVETKDQRRRASSTEGEESDEELLDNENDDSAESEGHIKQPPSKGKAVSCFNFDLYSILFDFILVLFQPVNGRDWLQERKIGGGKIQQILRKRNTVKCVACDTVKDWPKRPSHGSLEPGQLCKDCKNFITSIQARGIIGVFCPKTKDVSKYIKSFRLI